MRKYNRYSADELRNWTCDAEIGGKWVAARPVVLWGFFRRLSMAWEVFTGKSDVLTWYKQ